MPVICTCVSSFWIFAIIHWWALIQHHLYYNLTCVHFGIEICNRRTLASHVSVGQRKYWFQALDMTFLIYLVIILGKMILYQHQALDEFRGRDLIILVQIHELIQNHICHVSRYLSGPAVQLLLSLTSSAVTGLSRFFCFPVKGGKDSILSSHKWHLKWSYFANFFRFQHMLSIFFMHKRVFETFTL